MIIVYLSNFFNHHQKPVADAFYKMTDGNYWFVETANMSEEQKLLGYHKYEVPYTINYADDKQKVIHLIREADVVIHGEAPVALVKERLRSGRLTFHDNERRYKALIKYLKWPIYTYHSLFLNKGYLLCSSAYAARDFGLSGMSAKKCFKWGYFTEVKSFEDIDIIINRKSNDSIVSILWACRMIDWKHPEMAVVLAQKLRDSQVNFKLRFIGRGPLESEMKKMVSRLKLDNYVEFLGSMPPESVRTYMEESEIFIATSDQNEGWGATVNEAMSSACAVVASHAIGAVPFLIKDGMNGLVFQSKNSQALYEGVKWLVDNPAERRRIAREAYFTMKNEWCAETASKNFIQLAKALTVGEESPIQHGPCSKAPIINHTNKLF